MTTVQNQTNADVPPVTVPTVPTVAPDFVAELNPDSYEVQEIALERRLNPQGQFVQIVDGKEVVVERRSGP